MWLSMENWQVIRMQQDSSNVSSEEDTAWNDCKSLQAFRVSDKLFRILLSYLKPCR